jgi:hypothetical protein
MGLGLLLIVIGAGMMTASGGLIAYLWGRLEKNIRRLETGYKELYGKQPKTPPNDTIEILVKYKTFLEHAVEQRLTDERLEMLYDSLFKTNLTD